MTSRRSRTKSSHFVSAVAFAERGLPSNMAISPNKLPACKSARITPFPSRLATNDVPTARRKLLKSISTGVISAVSDANLIVVLIVFIIVCLVALNVNVITSDESLAIPQFGTYPVRPSESPR